METFGSYILIEKIASGGMAEIYKAKMAGAGGFEKIVAIKRIRPELARSAQFVQMLIDEAKISVRLTHANIAQVINLEQVGDEWGLVLEYVDGVDLFRLERTLERHQRRMGIDECVHVAKQVLNGLEFVHRLEGEDGAPIGLVHCDVSPGNVMINVNGEVKLIDFGVARAIRKSGSQAAPGKVRYRAPEQIRDQRTDARSDIYSTGIVFWELLAGERIYDALPIEEILARVVDGAVPPIESMRPGLPDGLLRVLRRALYPDPKYRYAHAAAFVRALEDLEIGRDPARCQHVLSEIIGAVVAPRKALERRSSQSGPITVASEPSLEDVLEQELERAGLRSDAGADRSVDDSTDPDRRETAIISRRMKGGWNGASASPIVRDMELEERRRYPRVSLNLLIQYRFESFEDFMSKYASDISEGGMFIRTEDVHPEGSMVYLQFSLSDGTKLIEALGRVVRVNTRTSVNPGMGVEFVSFDPQSRAMIEAIVREKGGFVA